MKNASDEIVVMVHGLWMTGIDMSLLRYRIRRCGFSPVQFSYHSVRCTPEENAKKLQQFLQRLTADRIHFVAHSLGGLVVRHLFHLYPAQRPGYVVTIGTPHLSSQVARRLTEFRWGRKMLGKSVHQGLTGSVPQWCTSNPLGVIAGNRGLGAGKLICRFSDENDGTISVAETRLDSMSGHIIVPSSHTGLIYNKLVSREVCLFLKQGYFSQ